MVNQAATELAKCLPICDSGGDSDLISLCDIVVTAIDHHEFRHFIVQKYDPEADGERQSWGVLDPLPSAGKGNRSIELWAHVVRRAVAAYADDRLTRGMNLEEVRKMVDGSYTDVIVADSIIQFALYGEEVFG